MAEFVYNEVQSIPLNQPALLQDSIPCNKRYVIHEDGSGILILRGVVNNPCAGFARYKVTANGNIAIPEGGTAGPIAVALTMNGEVKPATRAIVTPAAVNEYFNFTCTSIFTIPAGCCFQVSLRNVDPDNDPTTTPAPVINIQNLNVDVTRVA